MVAPWHETQIRVVVEFKKSSHGMKRIIALTHNSQIVPPQLVGRVTPQDWGVFMTDLGQMALTHPYLHRPTVEYCCGWLGSFLIMLVVGFGCFQGDAGDYGSWLTQLEEVLNRHRAVFAAGSAALSIGHVHGSYWVQVDVNPQLMAIGAPVPGSEPPYYKAAPPTGTPPQNYT